jgi:hypothetical protein
MIIDELQQVLASWYPGSILDDTYDFVRLSGGTWFARARPAGVTAAQMYEDLLRNEDRLLVTCVDMDLASYVSRGIHIEERSIGYMPDYHISYTVQQRFAAVRGQDLDAARFFGAVQSSYSAAFVISPRTGYALTYDGCFAPTMETQLELQRRYPNRE